MLHVRCGRCGPLVLLREKLPPPWGPLPSQTAVGSAACCRGNKVYCAECLETGNSVFLSIEGAPSQTSMQRLFGEFSRIIYQNIAEKNQHARGVASDGALRSA
jgi:hypothetical protein